MSISEFRIGEGFERPERSAAPKSASRRPLHCSGDFVDFASTVPVGLFLYSLKTNEGVNVFQAGGYHAYMQCLNKSFPMTTFKLSR